jgi:glycosyltransferase involved in cell wall biosynthesis
MKILLTQASVYVPSHGGANKENRLMLEALAKLGHVCSAVVPACGVQAARSAEAFHQELNARGICYEQQPDADIFRHNGVEVTAVRDRSMICARLAREIAETRPDVVLVASEDPGQVLLDAAMRSDSRSVAYVARTTLALPFGPAGLGGSARGVELLRRVNGILALSHYLRRYFREWAGLEATVLPLSFHGPGPFPDLGSYDHGFITMVNPCEYKGLSIFAAMARACPDLTFAVAPTWGTTTKDLELIRTSNIRILAPVDDIDEILSVARVLVMPSLWAEARGRTITEAMLRGIPVIASDVGGVREAKLGVEYLLPVCPIVSFANRLDERMLPVPIVPEQDVQPWIGALRELLSSEVTYRRISQQSREAAQAANENETAGPLEEYLRRVAASSRPASSPAAAGAEGRA